MYTLAFECANFSASAALLKDGKILCVQDISPFYDQDALLIPTLEDMLQKQGIWYTELSAIVTTAGPGSFTGIRLGLATAQGISYAAQIPCYTFSVFHWWAWDYFQKNSQQDSHLLVVLDGRRAEVYARLFKFDGQPELDAVSILPDGLESYAGKAKFLVIGDVPLQRLEQGYQRPYADSLGRYARAMQETPGWKPQACLPFYLRQPDVNCVAKV